MNAKGPLRAVPSTSEADAASTLAALEQACDDPTLPPHLRPLLQQARDALRDAGTAADIERNRYRAVFDAVPDPVSIIDWDGTVLDVNKAGMAAYQRTREEIIGKPIEFLNPDLPRDHLKPVWETLNRGETFVVEVTNMRADGTRFPVEVHSAGFDDDGKTRIVAVARDLSGRLGTFIEYIGTASSDSSSPYAAAAGLGLTYALNDNCQLDCGVNVGLNDAAEDLNPFIGLTIRF